MQNMGIEMLERARFDAASLGAIVVRNDPGNAPWGEARNVALHVSGAEFNPIANLSRCFGLDTAFVTAMVPNHPLGVRAQQGIREMGVKAFYRMFEHNGMDGPNIAQTFSDRGWPGRPPKVGYNRANEAAQLLVPEDFDWDRVFEGGMRLFHCGGLFTALCQKTTDLAIHAFQQAKQHGAMLSYDLNWRPALWGRRGGEAAAQAANHEIAKMLDVLVGNEEDLQRALGIEGPDVEKAGKLDTQVFRAMIEAVRKKYPNLRVIATTLRETVTPFKHRWSAIAWAEGKFVEAPVAELDVFDRIGGGDGFAAGFFYSLLTGKSLEDAVLRGWAHGALITSFAGDTTMATMEMVEEYMAGPGSRVKR